MLEKEILEAFRDELGWKLKCSDIEKNCVKVFPDRLLMIIPKLYECESGILPGNCKYKLYTFPTISTHEFSTLCAKISNYKDPYEPLFVCFDIETDFYAPKFSLTDLRKIDERLSSWALSQDLEEHFNRLRNLPTNAKGDIPLRHLAALALAGDIAKLKSYQSSFEAGDRLGFVPYITKDYIDRALSLAEQQAGQ